MKNAVSIRRNILLGGIVLNLLALNIFHSMGGGAGAGMVLGFFLLPLFCFNLLFVILGVIFRKKKITSIICIVFSMLFLIGSIVLIIYFRR